MISLLHERGGFGLVLTTNAAIAFAMFVLTAGLAMLVNGFERTHAVRVAPIPAE
jgi:hypothetical protein